MAELTNKIEADVVLDKKLDATRYGGGDLHNYVASQEITVTITLSEYRELVSGVATKQKDIEIANEGKYAREQEIKDVKELNAQLKAENYDLRTKLDELKEGHKKLVEALEDANQTAELYKGKVADLQKRMKEAADENEYLQRNIDDMTRALEGHDGCD